MALHSPRSAPVSRVLIAVGLALVLAGCASAPGRVSPVAEASVAPSATPAEQPTVEPGPVATETGDPVPDPTAVPVTCDTILTTLAAEDLASSNLVPREFAPSSGDYPLLTTIDDDGIVCMWGNQGDVRQVMGQLAMERGDWESARAQLITEGFVQEDDVVEGFMNGPDADGDNYVNRGFDYRDGTLYYTSYSKFFTAFASFPG